MGSHMWLGTLAFLAGVMVFQTLPEIPSPWWYAALLPAALLAYRISAVRLPALVVAGFLWTMWRADLIVSTGLPTELEGKDVTVTGFVASLPERNDRSVRFDFDVRHIAQDGATLTSPGRVRLSWYDLRPDIHVGERWQLTVRMKRPRGFMNPGGFDWERHLFQNRIRATGYVREDGANARLQSRSIDYPVQRLRESIRKQMAAVLGDRPFSGIIIALAIGDSEGITRGQWDVFNRTSTSHLVAISGLHIGMIAALVFFGLKAAWGFTGRLALAIPAPRAAAVGAMMAAIAYSALAGFSIPTQRSMIMIAVVMAGILFQTRQAGSRVLALALIAVLLFDPLAVLSAGFWLSFGAVAAILFAMNGRLAARGAWWKWGRIHIVVALALSPLLLFLFQQVALLSPLANIIAVPVVSLVVVPMALTGAALLWAPAIGAALLVAADSLLSWLWTYLQWLSSLDVAVWSHPSPPVWALLPAIVGAAWLLTPRGWPSRAVGMLWLLPLAALPVSRPVAGDAWFSLLDVGQGLAAVVQTRGHVLVYDTGAGFTDDFDAGAAVVVPFLRSRGVTHIDMLVISHGDNDHIGGSRALRDTFAVAGVITSVPEKLMDAQPRRCNEDLTWTWDDVQFRIVSVTGSRFVTGNNASCVLQVSTASGSVLLPGDIEKGAEAWLVKHRKPALVSDILVAPHHGSNTSSTAEFIAAVDPRHVLFPIGYRNRYGFPRPQVTSRYRDAGVTMLDSSRHGAITFHLDATQEPLLLDTYRQSARRYWHTVDDTQG